MKRIALTLFSFCIFIITYSCQPEPLLSVPVDKLDIECTGEAVKFSFVANRDWTVSTSADWCMLSKTEGNARGENVVSIMVSCLPNTSYDERNCTLTVTSEGKSVVVDVEQAEDFAMLVSKDVVDFSRFEGETQFQVKTNVSFTVSVEDKASSWLSAVQTKGLSDTEFTISVTENVSAAREGKIIVRQKQGLFVEEITVRQESGYIKFEDSNFKDFCAYFFDTNFDYEIDFHEALTITSVDLLGYGFSSLGGIEYFENLQYLNCIACGLEELDLSANKNLVYLNCSRNNLTKLNLSGLASLQQLVCSDNKLKELNLKGCESLNLLDLTNNNISSLDISTSPLLATLACENNKLTTLYTGRNTELTSIRCSNNPLLNVDLTNNTLLDALYCRETKLKSIDLSKCRKLTIVDLAFNPELTAIYVASGQYFYMINFDRGVASLVTVY